MKIDGAEAKRRLTSSRNIADLGRRIAPSVPPSLPSEQPKPEPKREALPQVNHEEITRGRQTGSRNLPEPLRDVMAASILGGNSAASVARAFGVSGDVAERAASGRVGGKPASAERLEALRDRKLDIQDKALLKLMQSLDLIDEEKLTDCSAKDLAGISSSLAKVHSSLEGKVGESGPTVNVTVYAPPQRDEQRYKVIDV